LVDLVGKKDSVQHQGQAKAERNNETIVKRVLVCQVSVSQQGIAIHALGSQRHGDDPQRQRAARDEEVLHLSMDHKQGGHTDDKGDDD
jgi:hypothetical protein